MAKEKFKSMWPYPVYVATFADGTTQRMSFASPAGKPIDFDRGRRLLAWACAQPHILSATEPAGYKLVRANEFRHVTPYSVRRFGSHDTLENTRKPIGMRGTLTERGIAKAIKVDTNGKPITWWGQLIPLLPAREDMTAGYVEHDGKRHDDPDFVSANIAPITPKPRHLNQLATLRALITQYTETFPDECRAARNFADLIERIAA